MIIAGFDIETTGLHWAKGDRITELAFCLYKDGNPVGNYKTRINPEREVGAKAAEVTGLTLSVLKNEPVFASIAQTVRDIVSKVDRVITHNGEAFDWPFLEHEFALCHVSLPSVALVDTLNSRWATPWGKPPSLEELAWSLGFEYDHDQAHGALYDADLTAKCYLEGKRLGVIPG